MRDFIGKVNDTAPLASGVLDAAEDNVRFEELERAVTASGIALDPASGPDSDTTMLAQSMTRHVGAALSCEDSGAANAYVLTMSGDFVAPTTLVAELRVRFRPGHANTGASTLNFQGLGGKPLVDHALSPLSGGELEVGRESEAMYRPDVGASGSWVIPAWSNALYVDPNPVAPTELGDGEGWSVNTGSNTGNLNFPGLSNSATLASTDIFARHVAGQGHKGITGAQLIAALAGGGGGLRNIQLITTSGTYTKTSGTQKALVIAVGGGGGGGGFSGVSCDGGGGGGMALAYVDLSATDTVACTIGAGGPGGAAAIGTSGGSTAFGSHAVATGGAGGSNNQIDAGTPGGAGTNGLLRMTGNAGGNANTRMGGVGGGSFFGGGGYGGTYNSDRNGGPGGGYGGGGGGGSWGTGGAGAPGCILVLEFA